MRPEPFGAGQTAAAMGLGVLGLLTSGLLPLLLGALESEHRLSAAGIGELATTETLSTAVVTAVAGFALPTRQLRWIGLGATSALAVVNAVTVGANGASLLGTRMLAGVPEGLLLWIAIGLIARAPAPARRAAVLFTAIASSQLVGASVLAILVLQRFGADGAYRLIAGVCTLAAPIALFLPRRYGPLAGAAPQGAPPLRGAVALVATLLIQAAISGVGVYLVPLALQAGVKLGAAHAAVATALGFEVVGGVAATVFSGRLRPIVALGGGGLAIIAILVVYALSPPEWLFVAASGAFGFAALLIAPFFIPVLIQADPSRRAAVQIGGAQLFGGAVGPLMAAVVVRPGNLHGVLALSASLIALSLGIVVALDRTAGGSPPSMP